MSILEEAAQLVDGPRQDVYGHPYDDFSRVINAAKALGLDPRESPFHHALYMMLVKMSRLVNTPSHRDSLVDIPGYARTAEKVLEAYDDPKRHERLFNEDS